MQENKGQISYLNNLETTQVFDDDVIQLNKKIIQLNICYMYKSYPQNNNQIIIGDQPSNHNITNTPTVIIIYT